MLPLTLLYTLPTLTITDNPPKIFVASPRLCRGMIPRGMILFRWFPDTNSF